MEDMQLFEGLSGGLSGELMRKLNHVDFEVMHHEAETVRKTRIRRGGVIVQESHMTPIKWR